MTATATESESWAPPARSARRSSRCSPSATSPPPRWSRSPPSARPGSEIEWNGAALECRALERRRRSRASTSSSPRPAARSAPSGRRSWSRPAPSSSTTPATGACTTTCRWSSPRSTPTRPTGHSGHRRQPQLHDDADGRRARADPSTRSGIERLVVSTYQAVSGTGQRAIDELRDAVAGGARRRGRRPPRSTRTRSPSTSCPRSRPSRTATTTRPRSAR